MVALRCTCEQGTNLWGEFWWIEGEHRWVFFDDEKTSETYTEQLTHCPECGRSLERKGLRLTTPSLLPSANIHHLLVSAYPCVPDRDATTKRHAQAASSPLLHPPVPY
jgi:hypothetical protein